MIERENVLLINKQTKFHKFVKKSFELTSGTTYHENVQQCKRVDLTLSSGTRRFQTIFPSAQIQNCHQQEKLSTLEKFQWN